MNILDEIKSITFDKNRTELFGIKSGILWGHSKDTNVSYPLLYISKPKQISQEDFEVLLDSIKINIIYNNHNELDNNRNK